MPFDPKEFLAQTAPVARPGLLDFGALAQGAEGDEATQVDRPGLLSSVGEAVAQGGTLGFADEIEGALKAAFTDKTYVEGRDEARTRYAAKREAHPIGTGLGEILGGVGTGLATGGAGIAARVGATGAKGAAAIAGAEGALSGAGFSEAKDAGGVLGDAATSGAVGAGLGYGLHKVFSRFVDTAPERHVEQLTKELTEGATPTESKRFAQGVGDLAVEVLEKDKQLMKAVRVGPEKGAEVVEERLKTLGPQTKPLYDKLDKDAGKVPMSAVEAHFDKLIDDAAQKPGLERVRDALAETKDNFTTAITKKHGPAAPGQSIDVPTQEVRQWVTRLLKQELKTWGGLNDTAAHEIKEKVYDAADAFLKGHLDNVAKSLPELEPTVTQLRELNRRIRAYVQTSTLLEHVQDRSMWKKANLFQTLRSAGLPGVAGVAAAGGDLVSGGLAYGGVRAVQAAGTSANRATTRALAGLVRDARAGNARKAAVIEAIKLGVPVATVMAVLGGMRNRPAWLDEIPQAVPDITGE
jgi:hypothetical protein